VSVRRVGILLAGCLAMAMPAWAAKPKPLEPPASLPAEVPARPAELPPLETSRVVWGVLLRDEADSVFGTLSNWLRAVGDRPGRNAAAIISLSAYLTRRDLPPVAAEANVQMAGDVGRLHIDMEGENYQGVRVLRASLDAAGRLSASQPLSAGMAAGERFKLGLTSTFDALVVLANVNARGLTSPVYPALPGQAVVLSAGQPVWLPLGEREYFQFAAEAGAEPGARLALTIRDPRSLLTGQAASLPALRRDDASGSSYVQAREPGRYPVITEAVRLQRLP
jgi:hypothetical protein